jgi:hypothetical protein
MKKQSPYNQIPREKLLEGTWYAGRGRNSNFGLWTGTYFLCIGSSMGRATIKNEAYYTPKAQCIGEVPEESWGTFQPFLALDDGDILEFDDSSQYAKTIVFPSAAGQTPPDPNWTVEGQKRNLISAKRFLGRK